MIRVVVELEKQEQLFLVETKEEEEERRRKERLPPREQAKVINECPEENYYQQLAIAKSDTDQDSLRARLREHVDTFLENLIRCRKKTQAVSSSSSSSARKKNKRQTQTMDQERKKIAPSSEAQSSSSSSVPIAPSTDLRKSQSSSSEVPSSLRSSGSSSFSDGQGLRSSMEILAEFQNEVTIYTGNPIVESFKGVVHLFRTFTPPYDEEGLPTSPDASWIPRSPSVVPVCFIANLFHS